MRRLVLFCVLGASCARAPVPVAGPLSLGLDGPATYQYYLEHRPAQAKMRHQVETRMGSRSEVIEGYFIMRRPDQFWVRAMSPLGATLFDVKATSATTLDVDVRLDALKDSRGPYYLARDIRRIYLVDCPATAPVVAQGGQFVVRCALPATALPIMSDAGPDRPDDALEATLSPGGVVLEKAFSRDGQKTATITYSDFEGPLAKRVELRHAQIPYGLTIALLDADLGFDASAVLQ